MEGDSVSFEAEGPGDAGELEFADPTEDFRGHDVEHNDVDGLLVVVRSCRRASSCAVPALNKNIVF